MKKAVLSLVAVVILVTMLPVTALAHGCHGPGVHCGGRRNVGGNYPYAACPVEGCDVYGPHEHNGTWYCNQSGIEWNNYGVCAVDGCTVLGLHEHDGVWYHCANYPDGSRQGVGRGRNWR